MTYTYFRPARTAGDVVPFKPRPGVPTLTIGGRKYVLSTDGGPLGDREDDASMEESPLGARLIKAPEGANKWRYLWAYDTDRQTIAMWRVSDGNEKLDDSARSQQGRIVALEKKGQLNRVTSGEFRAIEKEMRRREDEALRQMQESLEEAKSGAERRLGALVGEYFDGKVLPLLLRGLEDVQRGVVPIGFKPFGPAEDGDEAWLLRQRSSHVMGKLFQRLMTVDQVEAWLIEQGFDLGMVDPQSVQWAIDDVRDRAVEYLPARPENTY